MGEWNLQAQHRETRVGLEEMKARKTLGWRGRDVFEVLVFE